MQTKQRGRPRKAAEVVETKQVAVAVAHQVAVAQESKEDRLLEKILDTGNIETLERYIKLRADEEERQAKKDFSRHFAEMQSQFTGIAAHRVKQGYGYKYAPIEELQRTYNPIIFLHGFSYQWSEAPMENGEKRVTMIISGWGHEVHNSFDVPKPEDTGKQSNAIHDRGKQSTYGRRYTFISGFGVIIEDEDDDAAKPQSKPELIQALDSLSSAPDIEALKLAFNTAWALFDNDNVSRKLLTAAKNNRKGELDGTAQ